MTKVREQLHLKNPTNLRRIPVVGLSELRFLDAIAMPPVTGCEQITLIDRQHGVSLVESHCHSWLVLEFRLNSK
jgi:hypothetical protein